MLLLGIALGAAPDALGAPAPDVAVAYHGHFLTHPGVTGRVSWPLGEGTVGVGPELEAGGWVHPRHQVALFGRGGMAITLKGRKGGAYGLFAHLGVQRSTWIVPTYVVEDDELRRPALAGQSWATGTVGLHLGRNQWFVRPQLSLRGPQFHRVGTDLALQIGWRLRGAS